MLSFFSKLTALVFLSLAFAGFTSAFTLTVDYYTCTAFAWTVKLDSAEIAGAYYATFFVANSGNSDDYAHQSKTIDPSGDIKYANTDYSFVGVIPSGQEPGGSTWKMGLGLNDRDGNAFVDEIEYTFVANPCSSNPSATYTPSADAISTSPAATSPVSPGPNDGTGSSHKKDLTKYYIIAAVVGAAVLIGAIVLFFCMRKRRNNASSPIPQYYTRDGSDKDGYAVTAPVASVNQLPHQGHFSGMSDYSSSSNKGNWTPGPNYR